ncbi:hypothetical protein H8356DRAFT_1321654 [Neocallimastix lanati (nom. inval.)]|nr:hypothetical protein H8356DRAFT_1321654 [Neocallimastix sp. JGI-2020a]
MFADGTFYIAPIFSYQVFIIRVYAPEINSISNAAIKIFPNITIKYCVWHYKRSLEVQKNKLCYNEKNLNLTIITKGKLKEFGKKKEGRILIKTDEINDLIKKYKKKESELINKKCDKNDIIDLWYKCLLELNKL